MRTEIRTQNGITNIWSNDGGNSWCWSNATGEGVGHESFEAAVKDSESPLMPEITLNTEINFKRTRAAAIESGLNWEVEVGNCAVSEFAWFATEAEADAAHSVLLTAAENDENYGTVEFSRVERIENADENHN